jgi:hypothetical protein
VASTIQQQSSATGGFAACTALNVDVEQPVVASTIQQQSVDDELTFLVGVIVVVLDLS